uniref:Uncharacterized protein n=1 Tax=Odontella aurita TaxID=265563 RepID=A0A7S4MYP4_9STRA|mmetsp:Transcript_40457/g.121898  ORF Transcript_40457/g.121898 Transcript_40457/m.121898 type:complete len:195 (+) Transcript_40457:877-1461(+)
MQASVQLRGHVDRAASLADGSAEGLKQKTSYLRALFDAVTKEQKEFIEVISVSQRDFFSDVKIAELELRNGNKAVGEEKFEVALSHYDRAMDRIETKNFQSATKLLNSLCCHVCWNRANVRFKLGQSEEALSDIDVLLQNEVPADIAGCAQKLRANALRALGRDQEAQEAAGKALVINPGDKELRERMANHKLE